MRAFLLTLIVSVSVVLCACHRGPSVKTAQGDTVALSSFKGNWIVLNYWASWCESCKLEVAQLNRFNQNLPKNTLFFGIDYLLLPKETLQSAIKKLSIDFPVLRVDMSARYRLPAITSVPVSFVINPQGKWVATLEGLHTTKQLYRIVKQVKQHAHDRKHTVMVFSPLTTQPKLRSY